MPAARAHTVHEILPDPSAVKALDALLGQGRERAGKIGLLDEGAELRHLAARRQEYLGCVGECSRRARL